MFVRNFNSHLAASASVDALMENYDAELNKPLPAPPRDRTPRHRSLSYSPDKKMQAKGLTRLPNPDISRSTTPLPVEEKPSSGFFRFGKSMASSFNPLNILSKVTSSWRDAKEEMIHEAREKRELEDQKRLAEQTYAELKAAGQLGAQGSKPFADRSKVFATGYSTAEPWSQRDSGIALDFDSARSSTDTLSKPPTLPVPNFDSFRKSSLGHIRTPSLHDLKKVVSRIDLHKRSASASRSRSPEKEPTDGVNELRRSQSKKDLQKQAKLSRRVSDLEAKLETARKELHSAIAVPSVPPTPQPLPRIIRPNPTWKRYAPALPSLLSESLMTADNLEETKNACDEDKIFGGIVANAEERPKTRGFSGDALYQQPNQPLTPTFEFPATSQTWDIGEPVLDPSSQLMYPVNTITKVQPAEAPKRTLKNAATRKRKPLDDQISRPHKESRQDDSDFEPSKIKITKRNRATGAPAIRLVAKPEARRDERVELEFSPTSARADDRTKWIPDPESAAEDSMWEETKAPKEKQKQKSNTTVSPKSQKRNTSFIDSDSDWEAAKSKTLKKRRPSETNNSPKPQKDKAAASSLPVKKANVLTKPKPLPKPPVTIPEDVVLPQTPLETVHEEMMATSSVVLNGDPIKPTARSTPAHPGRHYTRSRSLSPVKPLHGSSDMKALPCMDNQGQSISPLPSGTIGRMMRTESSDSPVIVRPGVKDVPPMPTLVMGQREEKTSLELKEEYEWDEDIF
jgi:hypothetical protein